MSAVEETLPPDKKLDSPPVRPNRALSSLLKIAACLVIAALSWYLLREFTILLRPLLLAVFLAFIIHPIYQRLTRSIPRSAAVAVMVGGSVGFLYLLVLLVHGSIVELNDDLPRLTARAERILKEGKGFLDEHFPWLLSHPVDRAGAEAQKADQLRDFTRSLMSTTADALLEALVVGVYLLFLLLEVGSFPRRVRSAFPSERAEQILLVVRNIQTSITRFLHVKVQASVLLAVPVGLVLWLTGVKFPLLWAVLTFLCNFIPYIGSVIAVSLPLLFTFLQLEWGWRPIAAAAGVLAIHLVMTYVVEPRLVGRGVGLSPLIILVALTFWGQCWGLVGMFLAIPLTVMLKIVLENMALTRPLARLLAD